MLLYIHTRSNTIPEDISSEDAGLVLEPAQPGPEGRHVPLGHVERGVHDGLLVLLRRLLKWINVQVEVEEPVKAFSRGISEIVFGEQKSSSRSSERPLGHMGPLKL